MVLAVLFVGALLISGSSADDDMIIKQNFAVSDPKMIKTITVSELGDTPFAFYFITYCANAFTTVKNYTILLNDKPLPDKWTTIEKEINSQISNITTETVALEDSDQGRYKVEFTLDINGTEYNTIHILGTLKLKIPTAVFYLARERINITMTPEGGIPETYVINFKLILPDGTVLVSTCVDDDTSSEDDPEEPVYCYKHSHNFNTTSVIVKENVTEFGDYRVEMDTSSASNEKIHEFILLKVFTIRHLDSPAVVLASQTGNPQPSILIEVPSYREREGGAELITDPASPSGWLSWDDDDRTFVVGGISVNEEGEAVVAVRMGEEEEPYQIEISCEIAEMHHEVVEEDDGNTTLTCSFSPPEIVTFSSIITGGTILATAPNSTISLTTALFNTFTVLCVHDVVHDRRASRYTQVVEVDTEEEAEGSVQWVAIAGIAAGGVAVVAGVVAVAFCCIQRQRSV